MAFPISKETMIYAGMGLAGIVLGGIVYYRKKGQQQARTMAANSSGITPVSIAPQYGSPYMPPTSPQAPPPGSVPPNYSNPAIVVPSGAAAFNDQPITEQPVPHDPFVHA